MTEDALSRRPVLEHTTDAADMLSLADPDEFGLPHPTGSAPPSSLAAPLIEPSYDRPPMDHDGVMVFGAENNINTMASIPLDSKLNDQLVRCTSLRDPVEVSVPELLRG